MSGKDILASTIISIVLISAVGFVALPMLYPSLQGTTTENVEHIEVSSQASINDDAVTSFVKIPDTELNITISNNSIIDATFTSPFLFGVGPGSTAERYRFEVALVIEGVGNQTILLTTFNSGTTSNYYEFSSTMYIHYISPKLQAGSYTVSVYYKSDFSDVSNMAYLTLSLPSINQTRSLFAMELK